MFFYFYFIYLKRLIGGKSNTLFILSLMAIIVFVDVVVVKIEIEIAFVQNCDRATFHCFIYIDFFEFSKNKIKLKRDLKIRIKIHY